MHFKLDDVAATVAGNVDNSVLIRHWTARIMAFSSAWRAGWCRRMKRFEDDDILDVLGFLPSREGRLRRPPQALGTLISQDRIEDLLSSDDLYRNVDKLGERLSLTEAERRLLVFVCYKSASEILNTACCLVKDLSWRKFVSVLAKVVDVPEHEAQAALRPGSVLRATQLLTVSLASGYRGVDLAGMLDIEDELQENLHVPDASDEHLVSLFYRKADKPSLGLQDYVELKSEVEMISRLLMRSVQEDLKGVNVLFYGPPGTGKSELAKVIGDSLGMSMAFVPEEDRGGDALTVKGRMGRYNGCQRAIAHDPRTLVVFDEAEDCLCDNPFSFLMLSRRQTEKSSMTRLLETNPRPTIWISNRVDMDPAFLRRFTHVLHLDNPGPSQRERLVREAMAEEQVSERFLTEAIKLESLSPAILHSSLRFARLVAEEGKSTESLVTHNLNARFEAMGVAERLKVEQFKGLPWRGECLRASEDVAGLLEQLNPDVSVRFCLHGAPGTGKTAWGRQLAEQIQRPLIVRQASDLLDMYVGGTEKRIAHAFELAEREGAVLLIDEADSFIGNRQNAQRNWEVSNVNQFLASLEQFNGIFVATTNLLDGVDEAAMRRFDFVVRFDFLDQDGVFLLLKDLAGAYGITLPSENDLLAMLNGMEMLTPGDFAAIYRRIRVLRNPPDVVGVVDMLRDCLRYKKQPSQPIGFMASLH
jgi:SpoVK/Ycf46/Vps4 family AAA+-type ATPase